jgi:flagellar hook-basal body complex protein FliE
MDPIRPPATVPPVRLPEALPAGGAGAGGFAQALRDLVGEVNQLQGEAQGVVARLAAGEEVDLAGAAVSLEKASVGFQFLLQIRNKLLEAYQELMRMPV